MALTTVDDIQYEAWGGYVDPRLPERVWKGQILSTGDATGGDLNAFLRFHQAGGERLDNYFSLEEMYIRTSSNVAGDFVFESRNFGSVRTGIRPMVIKISLEATEAPSAAEVTPRITFPKFLGQMVFRGTLLELVWITNNVDGEVTTIWAGGYAWGPRSASAPNGGIVRPDPGLFPS